MRATRVLLPAISLLALAVAIVIGRHDDLSSGSSNRTAPSSRASAPPVISIPRTATGNAPGTVPRPEWRQALPGYRFSFPRDHASHPAFKTEWWYYTGHLRAKDRRTYGFELTFFRFGVRPPGSPGRSAWTMRNVHAAHFAVTDEVRGRFFSTDRASRGALDLAGASTASYRVWAEDWSALLQLNNSSNRHAFPRYDESTSSNSPDRGGVVVASHRTPRDPETHLLKASEGDYTLELALRPVKPPAIHGHNGVSQKSAGRGRASHYYSLTRLLGSGSLTTPHGRMAVTAIAWMDHEFGSNQLGEDQVGWDWFSIHLEDGRELMLYQLRLRDGRLEPISSGTLVERNGTTRHLKLADFAVTVLTRWRSPKTGGHYPSRWRVRVPSAGLDLTLAPTVADQELVTTASTGIAYWEGSVRAEGTARGHGYVELTGYAERFAAPI